MAGFGDIARQKREEFEDQQRQAAKKSADDQAAKEATVNARIQVLESEVRPIIESARSQLANEGIEVTSIDQFDVLGYSVPRRPSIKLIALTPPRKSDGYQAESAPVFIEADEVAIFVGYAERSYDKVPKGSLGSAPIGSHQELLTRAVTKLLDNYFLQLKDAHWLNR